jgi:hypothetical protein
MLKKQFHINYQSIRQKKSALGLLFISAFARAGSVDGTSEA